MVAVVAATLGACSIVPKELRQAPADNPVIAEVRADGERHIGREVRWGGTIIGTDNGQAETRIEIVARDLVRSGRPLNTDHSIGRFIAVIDGFIDPAVYAEGRDITVAGVIAGLEPGRIGDHDYSWPVIRVHHHFLWPPRTDPRDYPPGYYYHYDPWYPYYYHYPRYPRPVIIHPPRTERPPTLNR